MKKVSFETGFEKSGKEYGHIQAEGDIRNILTAFLIYFRDIFPYGYTDSHLGCTMNLVDYDMKVKYGQFGGDKDYLGLVFDGSGHWYKKINKGGYTSDEERKISSETKTGIIKILKDALGDDCITKIWNHEAEYTSFSLVLNIRMEWTEEDDDFKLKTEEMVHRLNKLSKSLQAVTA